MQMQKAIIGKKVGMTQIFDESGKVIPVTVIEAGPCVVTQKKTTETDGYNAVQLGFADGILFDESDDKNPTSMMYSVSKSRNAFLNKISADSSGTPIEQFEKRLALLKY